MRQRIEDIELSIRKISEKAKQQDECVRFDIGQPSFDTPKHVKEAARRGLDRKQGYTSTLGIEELRSKIVEEESMKNGVDPSIENVMVTTGGMGGLFAIFAAMLGRNDRAVFNDPCWGPYKMISEVNGNDWSQVEYWNAEGELSEEARKEIRDAELAVVNTPSNPSGRMLDKEQAEEIGNFCAENDTFLVSDEVYHLLNFEKEHYSPAAFTDHSAIIGSTSKNHAMTGWRVGWIVSSEENIPEFAKVARAGTACPPKIGQLAAIEALDNRSHVEEMRKEYRKRRDLTVERMEDLGWEFVEPEGAIYTFPLVGKDSWSFCLDMIEEGVAMVPGEPFGPESDRNVRICFGSTATSEIRKAFDILEDQI